METFEAFTEPPEAKNPETEADPLRLANEVWGDATAQASHHSEGVDSAFGFAMSDSRVRGNSAAREEIRNIFEKEKERIRTTKPNRPFSSKTFRKFPRP